MTLIVWKSRRCWKAGVVQLQDSFEDPSGWDWEVFYMRADSSDPSNGLWLEISRSLYDHTDTA